MNFSRRGFLGGLVAGSAAMVAPRAWAAVAAEPMPRHLPRALAALDLHGRRIAERGLIGLVDFSAPSREPRFHLVNVAAGRIERTFLVAHGSGSDPGNSGWLQRFSNRHGSNASSNGAFLTSDAYTGKHGRSRKLIGLDPDNSEALARNIVIHGASYVDTSLVAMQGRIGRSQGCFAFQRREIGEVLARLGPGHMIYASK